MPSDPSAVPARIVLFCDLESEQGQSLSFSLTESIGMADGTLLQLRSDRGWSTRLSGEDDPWTYKTTESMAWDARAVAGLEHDEDDEWYQWFSEALAARCSGVAASAGDLAELPIVVELSEDVQRRLVY